LRFSRKSFIDLLEVAFGKSIRHAEVLLEPIQLGGR